MLLLRFQDRKLDHWRDDNRSRALAEKLFAHANSVGGLHKPLAVRLLVDQLMARWLLAPRVRYLVDTPTVYMCHVFVRREC